ncbi:hypothetical protein [Streptomyces sp. AA1529]
MTRYDDTDDRPTLLDVTPDGREIRVGDPSPTLLDETPSGKKIYMSDESR